MILLINIQFHYLPYFVSILEKIEKIEKMRKRSKSYIKTVFIIMLKMVHGDEMRYMSFPGHCNTTSE